MNPIIDGLSKDQKSYSLFIYQNVFNLSTIRSLMLDNNEVKVLEITKIKVMSPLNMAPR